MTSREDGLSSRRARAQLTNSQIFSASLGRLRKNRKPEVRSSRRLERKLARCSSTHSEHKAIPSTASLKTQHCVRKMSSPFRNYSRAGLLRFMRDFTSDWLHTVTECI